MMDKNQNSRKYIKTLMMIGAIFVLFASTLLVSSTNGVKQAVAACTCCCGSTCATPVRYCGVSVCACQSTKDTGDPTKPPTTMGHITEEFKKHRKWLIKILFEAHLLPSMMLMTEQITTFAVHQMLIVGSFFDAKHQLETQRLLQEMQALAHKEYQPSEGMCQFGTTTRSLAASDRNSDFTQLAVATRSVQRQLLNGDNISSSDTYGDSLARLQLMKDNYCNPKDFGNGLDDFCKNTKKDRMNKDINFTHTIDYMNTLKIDFEKADVTPDEQDVMALSSNLYGQETPSRISEDKMFEDGQIIDPGAFAYMKSRSIAAKRSVAQAAYAAQVGLRTQGEKEVLPYMKAILEEMKIPDDEIKVLLGEERPSYYAQMEMLTKKLYQTPNFYADLYDKPVNVDRKNVSMQAIDLMQRRDMYRSQLRSEAIMAVWLETRLKEIESHYINEADPARNSNKPLTGLK